jgi:hypothetical protein
METLLIFFAIIAIQMIAAYLKQKKKAGEKPNIPEWESEPEYEEEFEEEEAEEPSISPPSSMPKPVIESKPLPPPPPPPKPKRKIHIDINKPEQGILWAAILQQPRYSVKWKPPCYR